MENRLFIGILFMVAVYADDDILSDIVEADAPKCNNAHSCKLESLGCFNDKYKRAMPEEILNERDTTSKVFGGKTIDWNNFRSFLEGFACRCAQIAASKGYTVIGLQFYGECWSGPNADITYDKYGPAESCINGDYRLISNSSNCGHFMGKSWTNHVYRINTPGCQRHNIEPLGCFHDDLKVPRPVPNYILNERDYTNKGWNGHLIDWQHWETYSPKWICRCADAASKRGHNYFSIQFWGECWSGTDADVKFNRNGGSNRCVNEYYKACSCNSYNCVGKAYTNYVYKLNKRVECDS